MKKTREQLEANGEKLPRGRARRGHISNAAISAAIQGSLGNVAYIARRLGCTRMTVWRRLSASPELKQQFDEENETMLDNAENELISLMNPSVNEDPRSRLEALKFYLNSKGKKRGYGSQSVDMNLSAGDKPIQPLIVFGDAGKKAPNEPAED